MDRGEGGRVQQSRKGTEAGNLGRGPAWTSCAALSSFL